MEKKLSNNAIIPQHLYIERDADKQLNTVISDMGRPGYVLVARQMGKTNLLINAKRNLENENDFFIYVDLSNPFPDARSCFENIIDTFLEVNLEKFPQLEQKISTIRKNNTLPPHRQYLNELKAVLQLISGKLVIVLDEIDGLVKTDYSDLIFSQIRSIYFSRINFPELNRLTYILSGVIDPKNLIKDPTISPFNIGAKIILNDFKYDEFLQLVEKCQLNITQEVSSFIYNWTKGNPRLSWDILSEIENYILEYNKIPTEIDIDYIIKQLYLINFNKPPVDHIRELVKVDSEMRKALIGLHYNKTQSISDSVKDKLYLAGIINYNDESQIEIKNKIIKESLNEEWLLSIKEDITISKALELISKDNYKEAINILNELLSNKAENGYYVDTLYYQLGVCYYKLRQFQLASDSLSKISDNVEKDSSILYFSYLFLKGVINFELNHYKDASISFKEIITKNRGDESFSSALISYGTAILSDSNKTDLKESIAFYKELKLKIENFSSESSKDTSLAYLNFLLGVTYSRLNENHDKCLDSYNKALLTDNDCIVPQIYLSLIGQTREINDKYLILNKLLTFLEEKKLTPINYIPETPIDFSWTIIKEIFRQIVSLKDEPSLKRLINLYDSISIINILEIIEDFILTSELDAADFLINFIKSSSQSKLNDNQHFQLYSYEVGITTFKSQNLHIQAEYINTLAEKSHFSLTKLDLLIINNTINGFTENKDYKSAIQLTKSIDKFKNRIVDDYKMDFLILLHQKALIFHKQNLNTKEIIKDLTNWIIKNDKPNDKSLVTLENLNIIKKDISHFLNNIIKYDRNDLIEYERNGIKLSGKFKTIDSEYKNKKIKITNIVN